MYSTIHPHLAQALSPAGEPYGAWRPPQRGQPPPRRRLRAEAAHALASAAGRLDRERARRALA